MTKFNRQQIIDIIQNNEIETRPMPNATEYKTTTKNGNTILVLNGWDNGPYSISVNDYVIATAKWPQNNDRIVKNEFTDVFAVIKACQQKAAQQRAQASK